MLDSYAERCNDMIFQMHHALPVVAATVTIQMG